MLDKETLNIYRLLRTADISDALDGIGLQGRFEMNASMRPIMPGITFAGIAHTYEYRVTDKLRDPDGTLSPEAAWVPHAGGAPDEVMVIDARGIRAGMIGGHNTLRFRSKGTVGFVIDGSCRDLGECLAQKMPIFSTTFSGQHATARIVLASENRQINCAGVVVNPGDVIVGDDDGVMVVPRQIAVEIAHRAKPLRDADRAKRRKAYEELGLKLDSTVD
ncbi:RraA family protein [Paraburkholderia sp.]|uniref:RraA family protein n=1 Tax=Paraburkholderia sp. TaxID=1926495 RepID=UPI0039E34431